MTTKHCDYCGKEFIPTYPHQTYCSDECKQRNQSYINRKYYINKIEPYNKKHLKKSTEDYMLQPKQQVVVKIEQLDFVKTFKSLHLALQFAEVKVIEGYNVEICLWSEGEG